MKISEIYNTGKKSLSFEIFPPKKDSELKMELAEVALGVAAVEVIYAVGGRKRRTETAGF